MWQDRYHPTRLPVGEKDILGTNDGPDDPAAAGATERSALAAEVLRRSGRLRLQVRGESMLPLLWPGDIVDITRSSLDDVRPGEIVLALRDGRFFLHRFVTRRQSGFVLHGDSMPAPDPQFAANCFLGRLAGHARHACDGPRLNEGTVASRVLLPLRPWSWVLGRVLCYCGPARRLALKFHIQPGQRRRDVGNSDCASLDGIIDPRAL